ncbi:MAG: hypothetical protein EYC62_04505 [Alphaproteobacteria bacterium]|nr:MAG: hypothetical protein EYC62_04505 [Alphaproteobacteria bacterium]
MILKRQDLLGEQGNYLQEEALASLAKTTPITIGGANPTAQADTNGNRPQPAPVVKAVPANPSPTPAKAEVSSMTQANPTFQNSPMNAAPAANGQASHQPAPNIFNAGYANPQNNAPNFAPAAQQQPAAPIYAANPAPAAPAPQPTRLETRQQQGGEGRRLVVGPDISLNGEITTCDILVVEGHVQAALKDCKQIEIAPSGTFKGNAEIDNAMVAGNFEGNLTVRNRLHVMPGGKITGSVRYGTIQVDAGGEINGDLQSLSATPRAAAPTQPANQTRANNNQQRGGGYQGQGGLYGTSSGGF